jgi:hypothetical protein
MTPAEVNTWAAFLIVGLPILVVLGGGLILHMAIALAVLAMFFSHPALAIVLGILWFLPWRWFIDAIAVGFGLGEGLKLAGFGQRNLRRKNRFPRRRRWSQSELSRYDDEGRRGAPRLRGRRPADYRPFDDTIDFG